LAGGSTVAGAPAQSLPVAWQVAQVMLVTTECTIAEGAVPLAFVN